MAATVSQGSEIRYLIDSYSWAMMGRAYSSNSDAEKTVACDTGRYLPCNGSPNRKSSAEIRKEIAALEFEIVRLERYILSLYRGVFQEHLYAVRSSTDTQLKDVERSQSFTSRASYRKRSGLGRRSLADHLDSSFADDDPPTAAEKLSQDILRCIASVYCKLVDPPQTQGHSSDSPTSSSLSSSSIFSSHNPRDSWSPSRNEESAARKSAVEVLDIYLDGDNFKFADVMLKKCRSLIQGLESVDPRKLKREEKLAFWINLDNALMMHVRIGSFLGTENRIKSSDMLQAAYNVGGHSVNTQIIQTSILAIRSHHPVAVPWLQTLFAPGRKIKAGSIPHLYALDYPEPLVHFALCSGTYSDPPVRAYASKTIFADLKHAKEDYVRVNVKVHKDSKILLPRILDFFAKDMMLSVQGLLDVVGECLSEAQREVFEKCRAEDRRVQWLPHNQTFRYFIQGDLAREKPDV